MTTQWRKDICNEKSGFLFSHPCDRLPNQTCSLCEKPICNDHAHPQHDQQETKMVCTTCAKKARKITKNHQRQRGYRSRDFYDDPYFYGPQYGGYWYRRGIYSSHHDHHHSHDDHWGHDRNDFTEADGESFQQNFGDDEFESDMTES